MMVALAMSGDRRDSKTDLARAAVWSVEPSSTMMQSNGSEALVAAALMASSMIASWLNAGVTIVNRGSAAFSAA
jgi:hypothetical protein